MNGVDAGRDREEEEELVVVVVDEEKEEEGLFTAKAVKEVDAERDRATQS